MFIGITDDLRIFVVDAMDRERAEEMIWLICGVLYIIIVVFTLAICKAADRADRQMGMK